MANGFEVPYANGHPEAGGLLKAFKEFQKVLGAPPQHAAMVRAALAAESQVSIVRTVREMHQFYQRVLAVPISTPPAIAR